MPLDIIYNDENRGQLAAIERTWPTTLSSYLETNKLTGTLQWWTHRVYTGAAWRKMYIVDSDVAYFYNRHIFNDEGTRMCSCPKG